MKRGTHLRMLIVRCVPKNPFIWSKILQMGFIWLIITVLVYKKGSKTKNNTTDFENRMSQLSNALSIVFISLKLVKICQIKVFSVAPPKGPETLLGFSNSGI